MSDQMMRTTAYSRIESLLNEGTIQPGQLISQRELVELTGTTLGSIREAISRLEAEGLLQALPKRGLMVPSMDVAFIREAYQLRMLLELGSVDDAIQNIPRASIADWIQANEQALHGDDIATQDEADALQKLDWKIHSAMIASMRNDLVMNVYRVTAIKIRMAVQHRLRVTPYMSNRVATEHLAFLVPMYDGDATACRAALETHIAKSLTLALGGTPS
ncbi:GntR family transcriptional regulator [Oceanicola sp. S124]|uniref:GntR family transcriptional regulator n=1 Tax=Oceanicola sp. S124 TaxID=1042378 RepID=UPI0002558551|nr:GntR family transcriptional regulator [Oceanicola sp. S124]